MEKIAVVGLGMLGCSLCASLEGSCVRLGWSRRPEVGQWAVRNGLLEEACATVEETLAKADLNVLCLPIPVIMEYLHRYAPQMKDTLVTDIGSVKGCIERAAVENGVRFVGSHPMAGTEKSGPESLVRGIYEGASVFIVPPPGAAEADIAQVESLWRKVKAKPRRLSSQSRAARGLVRAGVERAGRARKRTRAAFRRLRFGVPGHGPRGGVLPEDVERDPLAQPRGCAGRDGVL